MKRIALVGGLLLVAAALAGVLRPEGAHAVDPAPTTDTVTVTGTGVVLAVPDRAQVSAGVETRAATAKAALDANGAAMRKVIAALKAAGATEVKTQYVSLSPRYDERNQAQGFSASNSVSASVREIARAGAVIDAAVAAGANQVYGPNLTRGDQTELYRDALKAAVANARASAQALASASGLALGRVTAIVEGGGAPQPLPFAMADKAMEAGSTPIEPGTQEVSASVSVTFAAS